MAPELKQIIASLAIKEAAESVEHIAKATSLPEEQTEQVKEQIGKILTQDPLIGSNRVWSAVFSAATAVLMTPDVQAALLSVLGTWIDPIYLPLVTAVMAAMLATLSKRADKRPFRT